MVKSLPWLGLVTIAMASGCAGGTVLEVEAIGLPNAELVFGPDHARLDELGRAELRVEDQFDSDVRLEVRRGDVRIELSSVCRPPPFGVGFGEDPEPLDAIRLFIRRDLVSSQCVLIAYEARLLETTMRGEYDPSRFDDAPCGPFGQQDL